MEEWRRRDDCRYCRRRSIPREKQICVIDHQFLSKLISATTHPLATPFDRDGADMLNWLRKIAGAPFTLLKHLKSTLRPSIAARRLNPSTSRANWSSGMSYGGGGVAKGGYDCRYCRREEECPRRKSKSCHRPRIFVTANLGNHSSTRYAV